MPAPGLFTVAANHLGVCAVMDVHARMVVGGSMRACQDRQPVIQAVLMVLWPRTNRTPVILTRIVAPGSPAISTSEFLKGHNLIGPMSDAGECADNAAAKSLFGLLKRERINRCHDRTQAQARADVFDYIECFHNPQRRRRMELRKVDLTKPSEETG